MGSRQDKGKEVIELDQDNDEDNASQQQGNVSQHKDLALRAELVLPGAEAVLEKLQTRIALSADDSEWDYSFVTGCNVVFFQQTTDFTCSYCSLMMITTALLSYSPAYREQLFMGMNAAPDVTSIQRLIEASWKEGFDVDGSHHFNGSLVGKRSRIGPSDIAALLRAQKIPTSINDFDYGRDSFASALKFVEEYFFNKNEFDLLPLVFGTASHTVVTIGCRRNAQAIELIVFDPAMRATQAIDCRHVESFLLRDHKANQFQVLTFGPCVEHPSHLLTKDSSMKFGSKQLFAVRPPRVVKASSFKRHKSQDD